MWRPDKWTWNILVGLSGVGACTTYAIAVASRPAATVWTVASPVFWTTLVAFVFGAVMVGRVGPTFVLMPVILVAMIMVSIGSLTVGQRVAREVLRSQFVEFAEQARITGPPTTERFRIGPFTYNRICVSDESVVVWDSGDDFMGVPAIRIALDGDIEDRALREGSYEFVCARRQHL